jgi:GAF domain-containing protein
VDGACLRLVAHHASIPAGPVGEFTVPLIHGMVAGRTVLERRLIHVTDLQKEIDESPEGSALARRFGHRTILSVPLLREGVGTGAYRSGDRNCSRSPRNKLKVELLQSFADQAVIAIENVRLFTELQEKNKALTAAHAQVTEALEQQTTTSEILQVIASSPTDLQPVLDAMAESAAHLCTAYDETIFPLDGDVLSVVAHHGPVSNPLGRVVPWIRGTVTGRTVLDRQTVQVHGSSGQGGGVPEGSSHARELGHRTILSVPLLREGVAIGAIVLRRIEVQPFTDKQIALLQTFASQAVIAIENARLFTETKETARWQVKYKSFIDALRELNHVEGRNLIIKPAFADSKAEPLPGLVADLISAKVDVIVASSEIETVTA